VHPGGSPRSVRVHPWLLALRRRLLLGEIRGRTRVARLRLGGAVAMPAAVAFHVGDRSPAPLGVGAEVKRRLFPGDGDFVVNVAFARGAGEAGGYGIPGSLWSTAFAGHYAVDVPRATWARPFGYASAVAGAPPVVEELGRLAQADWNWFTARPYGVPLAVLEALDAHRPGPAAGAHLGRVSIGGAGWDEVELHAVTVACPHHPAGGPGLETPHRLWSPLWRLAIGRPRPGPPGSPRFPLVPLRARFFTSHREGVHPELGPVWSTLVCGGTVRADHPDPAAASRFLDAQVEACRALLATHHGDAGFPAAARAPGGPAAFAGVHPWAGAGPR